MIPQTSPIGESIRSPYLDLPNALPPPPFPPPLAPWALPERHFQGDLFQQTFTEARLFVAEMWRPESGKAIPCTTHDITFAKLTLVIHVFYQYMTHLRNIHSIICAPYYRYEEILILFLSTQNTGTENDVCRLAIGKAFSARSRRLSIWMLPVCYFL